MKVLVEGLGVSLSVLLYVMPLLAFVFLLFGILGVQLFADGLRNRCFDDATGTKCCASILGDG